MGTCDRGISFRTFRWGYSCTHKMIVPTEKCRIQLFNYTLMAFFILNREQVFLWDSLVHWAYETQEGFRNFLKKCFWIPSLNCQIYLQSGLLLIIEHATYNSTEANGPRNLNVGEVCAFIGLKLKFDFSSRKHSYFASDCNVVFLMIKN